MITYKTKPKVCFAPDAFVDFMGTQQELDEIVQEIYRMAASGELLSSPKEEQDNNQFLYTSTVSLFPRTNGYIH